MERWLPTCPHKRKSKADQLWPHTFACELDPIEPDDLRALVRWTIEHCLPRERLQLLQAAEVSKRQLIRSLVGMATSDQAKATDDGEDPGDACELSLGGARGAHPTSPTGTAAN